MPSTRRTAWGSWSWRTPRTPTPANRCSCVTKRYAAALVAPAFAVIHLNTHLVGRPRTATTVAAVCVQAVPVTVFAVAFRAPERRVRVTAEALFEMDGQLPAEERDAFVHQDLYPALELIGAD